MHDDPQDKLAEVIHRELMALPEPAAPETLIAAVLARIEERKRHWWKQPWTNWPFQARIVSLAGMLLCAGMFLTGLQLLFRLNLRAWLIAHLEGWLRPFVPAWEFTVALLNNLLLSARSLEGHWILLSATVAFLMYLSCVAVGTACFRVALQKP